MLDVISPFGNMVVKSVVEQGKTVLKYQSQVNESQCKKAFEIEFEGYRAICLNGGGFNSNVFDSVYDETKHDIMMPFQFNGKFWTISIYSTKPEIDCSVMAKKFGGGGHLSACGFQTEDIKSIFYPIK
jgi:oligoribonuclease NrnB/cAMP/cGMP phosphodiesterase (DHH superfamily)